MNDQQRARWATIRAKGKWRFILRTGIGWASWMTVFVSGVQYVVFPNFSLITALVIGLPVYGVGGIILGLRWWCRSERAYHQHDI